MSEPIQVERAVKGADEAPRFHLGDILSILTPYLLAPEGMAGVARILDYMEGSAHWDIGLGAAATRCRPTLRQQFPQLCTSEVSEQIGIIVKKLESGRDGRDRDMILGRWLTEMAKQYGEYHEVPRKSGNRWVMPNTEGSV